MNNMIYKLITENEINDISMFLIKKDYKYADDVYISKLIDGKRYQVQGIKAAFQNHEIFPYGGYADSRVKELIIFEYPSINISPTVINIPICTKSDVTFLQTAIENFKSVNVNENYTKIKIMITQKQLNYGFADLLEKAGFKMELLFKKGHDTDDNMYCYSFFL